MKCDICQHETPADAGLCDWCHLLEVDQPRNAEWWVA